MFEIEDDVLKLQVLIDIVEDYRFIEKNSRLIPEINGLRESLENKISDYLVSSYGRFGEYDVAYYYDGEVVVSSSGNITECIDELCYKIFNATPVINNEFVNKQNITTGQLKQPEKT